MKYELVTQDVMDLLQEVRDKWFSELWEAKILVLFDTKKTMVGGKIGLAKIRKTDDLLRLLTQEDDAVEGEGYDYIICVDRNCWTAVGREDQIRILRHELRHAKVDYDSEDPWKVVSHDYEDFRQEILLNVDDPDWAQRCAQLTESIYQQEKDAKKEGIPINRPETIGQRVSVRKNLKASA